MPRKFQFLAFLLFSLIIVMPVWSQANSSNAQTDTESVSVYIGMKLDELHERFGPPLSVYSSRGEYLWQDDVVFVYPIGDFYIFKDRVWQLGLKKAYGVSIGDPKPAVMLALGEDFVDHPDCIIMSLPPTGWPLMLRVNFNSSGRAAAIFIYRPDY
jgi:hypothetical protein